MELNGNLKLKIAIVHLGQKIGNILLSFSCFVTFTTYDCAQEAVHQTTNMLEKATASLLDRTGLTDFILVNRHFTASTFAKTFSKPHSRGVRPAVLYPAGNVGDFDKRLKKNVRYIEELKGLALYEGFSDQVNFVTSCAKAERNTLLF